MSSFHGGCKKRSFIAEEKVTIQRAVLMVHSYIAKFLEQNAGCEAFSLIPGTCQDLLWAEDFCPASWTSFSEALHGMTAEDIDDITVIANLIKVLIEGFCDHN